MHYNGGNVEMRMHAWAEGFAKGTCQFWLALHWCGRRKRKREKTQGTLCVFCSQRRLWMSPFKHGYVEYDSFFARVRKESDPCHRALLASPNNYCIAKRRVSVWIVSGKSPLVTNKMSNFSPFIFSISFWEPWRMENMLHTLLQAQWLQVRLLGWLIGSEMSCRKCINEAPVEV